VIIYDNHFKHFHPIGSALRQQKRPFTVIYLNRDVYERRKGSFENEWLVNDFMSRRLYAGALWFQLKLLLQVLLFRPENVVKKYPIGWLLEVINCFAKRHYMLQKVFKQILKKTKGKLILFKAEDYLARTILSVARQAGVKTFAVQHGLINVHSQFSDLEVCQYLVWSDFFKQRLKQSGAGCDILVVGNAAYDHVFDNVVHRNQMDKSAPVILALPNSGISHTSVKEVFHLLKVVAETALAHSGWRFIIKPHPGDVHENAANYFDINFPGLANIAVLGRHDAPPFESCDVVVINNSTAGMEAAIWERPLVVIAENLEDVMVPQYLEEGIGIFVNSSETFRKELNHILDNYEEYRQNCRSFVNRQLANPGKAVAKILEVLIK
jgi:hypothetical protein